MLVGGLTAVVEGCGHPLRASLRFAKGGEAGGLVGRVSELGIYGIKGWTSIGRWL